MRLAYLQKPEQMLVAHKQALQLMSEINANPNPVNYHLFYVLDLNWLDKL